MDNRRNGYEIWQALSRFSPDVFAHPVWVNFIYSNKPISNQLILALQEQSQQFIASGDTRVACQILLICAVLNKRSGKLDIALDCLQSAWELADTHKMPEVVEWAAWGSSALHILLGQPDQAVSYLRWLSSQLSSKGDWVLADLVELFATELTDRAKGIKSLDIPLDWLVKWGEISGSLNGTYSVHDTSNTSFVQSMQGGLFSFFTKFSWNSIWSKLKSIASGQNALEDREKTGQAEYPLKSTNDIPLPPQTNLQLVEQSPPTDSVIHQPGHLPPRFTHSSDPSISSSMALENPSQKLPARAEDGRIVLAVYCLGQFRVSLENQWISSWPSGKGKSILKFMIVNYPRPISKDVLMDTIWRDADPVAARNSLYVAIYGLRQAFKAVLPGFNPVLFEDDRYCLNPAMSVWLDVEEFLRLYQNGQELEQSGKLVETIQAYESVANLYQGDFLADDLYEEWPILTRERLRITYLDTLDRLSRIYFNKGQYLSCVNLCHLILTRDNCREDAHRRLMRCYSRQGQHQLALSQFQVCVDTLRSELGVDPEQVTMQLAERIRLRESV